MRVPSYRRHSSGQARVTINGKDILLGPYDSPESHAKHKKIIADYLLTGAAPVEKGTVVTVRRAIDRFWHARADEMSRTDRHHFKTVLRFVVELYGDEPVSEFGPRFFKVVRQQFVTEGWCRNHVNRQASRIKEFLRWLVGDELYPADKLLAVRAVPEVKKGEAPDHPDVAPVAEEVVDATLPYLPEAVRGIVALQRWTGCRPGEAVIACAKDIDTRGRVDLPGGRRLTLPGVWVYVPSGHKGDWLDKPKWILIGPKGQRALAPFLKGAAPDAYLFSPLMQNRNPYAGPRYKVGSYAQAVARACRMAWPLPKALERGRVAAGGRKRYRLESKEDWRERLGERWALVEKWRAEHHWHPHQLRHLAASALKEEFGEEVAKEVLGHAHLDTTAIYAERALKTAADAIRQAG